MTTFVEIWASITAGHLLSAAGGSISVTNTREKSATVARVFKICS
jgi:hypothetical protein